MSDVSEVGVGVSETPAGMEFLGKLKEILKTVEDLLVSAGARVEYTDNGLGMKAEYKGEAVWISQVYSPDRDGFYGWRMATRGMVEAWLKSLDEKGG